MVVLLPPAVSVPVPSVTLPAPASEPTVSLNPLRSSVATPATVTALASVILSVAARCAAFRH